VNKLSALVVTLLLLNIQSTHAVETLPQPFFNYLNSKYLGNPGVILIDNESDYISLKKMSYDGRLPNIPWRDQDIDTVGFHYYMTPETAQLGLDKLQTAIDTPPRQWVVTDWPDLTEMQIFKK